MSRSSQATAALAGNLRVTVARLMRRLREQGSPDDFTHAQKSVLLRLDRDGPATVSALARAEGVRPQSMRVTVAALEALGAVQGAPDPADGRQTIITIGAATRQRLKDNRAAREDWLFHALNAQLSAQEQAELDAAVALLQRLADF